MNSGTLHATLAAELRTRLPRRPALRKLVFHSRLTGLAAFGVFASGNSSAAGPSADCKFSCKKKEHRKARRHCYDRCNNAT